MTDIDWLAVEMVCEGTRLSHLTAQEKRAVIRRLSHRLVASNENNHDLLPHQLTSEMVAQRLGMSRRNVERIKSDLPDGVPHVCPVCRGRMWVLPTNVVEPHGNGVYADCDMSDRMFGQVVGLLPSPFPTSRLRGLASLRPDLYGWLVAS